MKPARPLRSLAAFATLFVHLVGAHAVEPQKPNIVVLLADDFCRQRAVFCGRSCRLTAPGELEHATVSLPLLPLPRQEL